MPLIFTFYSEKAETTVPGQGQGGGGETPTQSTNTLLVSLNVAEIERVVKEDVMEVAQALELNVTVEGFTRFGRRSSFGRLLISFCSL